MDRAVKSEILGAQRDLEHNPGPFLVLIKLDDLPSDFPVADAV